PETRLMVAGISHHTAGVGLREALAFGAAELPQTLQDARRQLDLPELMVLSTCNRVEVYAAVDDAAAARLVGWLRARGGPAVDEGLYRHEGEPAVQHAFRVAAGLDSLVVGEPQILGQMKDAFQLAQDAGTLGPLLNALRHRTLNVAKRVRTETGIGRHAVSVSHVAVELARKIFDPLRGRQVLLVGSGKMCALAARRLAQEGAEITVLGRTLARAQELAAELGGRPVAFAALRAELGRADIVISGTASPGTIISRADLEAARAGRGARPLFVIDIALPRDVDPAARELSGVFLYDLDDLKGVADANLRARQREAGQAETLVGREARAFTAWQRSRGAAPLLVELRRRGDLIRRQETERARRRMGALTPEQENALEAVTAAIVNKLLHAPTVHLKQMAQEGDDSGHDMLVRALFGLT
ncbi:MAG TPA: glutamyl-tRNA reductase, partial [Vicinamibacteria bacterium]|nr:glutamyl-tRNA reductase [Vicinamibacteria bacterium]